MPESLVLLGVWSYATFHKNKAVNYCFQSTYLLKSRTLKGGKTPSAQSLWKVPRYLEGVSKRCTQLIYVSLGKYWQREWKTILYHFNKSSRSQTLLEIICFLLFNGIISSTHIRSKIEYIILYIIKTVNILCLQTFRRLRRKTAAVKMFDCVIFPENSCYYSLDSNKTLYLNY